MAERESTQGKDVVGSVLVVGGGIAGIQAALDLADSGYFVHMTESKSAIGGVMAQLDKTFPTNDCSMCIISPKLVECGRHLNIDLMTLTEIEAVSGEVGDFTVQLRQNARYIEMDKCTACGGHHGGCHGCAERCGHQGGARRRSSGLGAPTGQPQQTALAHPAHADEDLDHGPAEKGGDPIEIKVSVLNNEISDFQHLLDILETFSGVNASFSAPPISRRGFSIVTPRITSPSPRFSERTVPQRASSAAVTISASQKEIRRTPVSVHGVRLQSENIKSKTGPARCRSGSCG